MNAADTLSFAPRSPLSRWILASAIAAFVGTRLAIYFWMAPWYSGVPLYLNYAAETVDFGRTPFVQIPMEYPPAAYWVMALPRALDRDRFTRADVEARGWDPYLAEYAPAFRAEMLLLDAASFALLVALAARLRPAWSGGAAWSYLLATTPLAHLLLDRLDVGMSFLLLLWAYAWLRSSEDGSRAAAWARAAHLVLGLSVAYKLVSIVAVPFVLLAEWRRADRWASFARGALMIGVGTVAPFVVHWPSAGTASLGFLKYHGERGIEIESAYASVLMLLAPLGFELQAVHGHGGWNVSGQLAPAAMWLATVLLLGLLAGAGLAAFRQGETYDRRSALRWGCAAVLLTVAFSKVLSPQYLLFALPLAMVAGMETLTTRRLGLLALGCCLVACLTTWIFPHHWEAGYAVADRVLWNEHFLVPDMTWLAVAVLAARNLLLAGGAVWLALGLPRAMRQAPATAPHTPAPAGIADRGSFDLAKGAPIWLLAVNGLIVAALGLRYGSYDPRALLLVVAAWAVLLAVAAVKLRGDVSHGSQRAPAQWNAAIGAWLALTGAAAFWKHRLIGVPPAFNWTAMGYALCTLLVGLMVLVAAIRGRTWGRLWPSLAVGLIVAGTCLHAVVPTVKPSPTIDVFTAFTDGAAALLRGENPYETPVRDPYSGGAERLFGYRLGNYMYPPANLPPHAASLAVLGDVRYAHIAGELATAIVLALVMRRKRPDLWRSPAALLAAGPLVFSKGPFLIEQSWNEPLMLAALAGWWCCCHFGRMRVGGLLFGAFLALKQYLIWWPFAFAADALARRRPALILLPPLVVGVSVAPFLVWNAPAFWEHAVQFMAQRVLRFDSLSIPAWLHHTFDVDVATSVPCLLLAGAVTGWTSLRIYRRSPTAASPEQVLLAGAAATMTMFLFGPQGFANYYYLVSQVVLLAAVGMLVGRPDRAGLTGVSDLPFHRAAFQRFQ